MADGFAQLSRLIASLDTLAADGATEVSEAAAKGLNEVVQAEYEQGKGPDGQAWANKADGTPSHLKKSGDMRRDTQVLPGVKGVTVRVPRPGGFHQAGTDRMQARKLVPDGEPLPASWEKSLEEATRQVITRGLK